MALKENDIEKFPSSIAKGILLHRGIDTFTDAHPIVHQSTARLHKNYSHYSGVIVDILYDHFLAKNWSKYSDEPLDKYVRDFYELLTEKFHNPSSSNPTNDALHDCR